MTKWHVYHFTFPNPDDHTVTYFHYQARCIDPPGHPRLVTASAPTNAAARLLLHQRIRDLLHGSEIWTIDDPRKIKCSEANGCVNHDACVSYGSCLREGQSVMD